MKKTQQQIRMTGECVFCGASEKLTGEHQYPKWLTTILPLELADKNHAHFTDIRPAIHYGPGNGRQARKKIIAGDPGSKKLRVVCGPCNNNWMSQLQDAAMPLLRPAIEGHWANFGDAHNVVARWCLMTAMVNEFDNPPTVAFSKEERNNLRLNIKLPENVVILIGKMRREEPTRMKSHRGWIAKDGRRFAVSTFHIGDFIFQVMKLHAIDDMTIDAHVLIWGMHSLWPCRNPELLNVAPAFIPEVRLSQAHDKFVEFADQYIFHGLVAHMLRPAHDALTSYSAQPWRFDPTRF